MDRRGGMEAVGAAAQHHGVAALQAQRAGVGGDVRPALVNDADDAERRRHSLDLQAVRPLESRQDASDRIGQGGDVLEPARDCLDALGIEREPVEKGGGEALGVRLGQIARIGGQDFALALAQNPRGRENCARLGLGRRVGERARRRARRRADRAHFGADVEFRGAKDGGRSHRARRGGIGKDQRRCSTFANGAKPRPASSRLGVEPVEGVQRAHGELGVGLVDQHGELDLRSGDRADVDALFGERLEGARGDAGMASACRRRSPKSSPRPARRAARE